MRTQLPTRVEIPAEFTWNAPSVFASDQEWEATLAAVHDRASALAAFLGRLSEGPAVLLEWLAQREDILTTLRKLFTYAAMQHYVDTNDQAAAARLDQARSVAGRVAAASAFGEPEMLALGEAALRAWQEREPRLAVYGHYFDDLFYRQAHVRSAEVEEVLGLARDAFSSAAAVHGILANADLRFEPARDSEGEAIEVGQSNIHSLQSHPDQEVRRTAWENYAGAHLAFKTSMAASLATGVKQNVFRMRARRYDSSLEAALHPNHIPVEVFHNTLDSFRHHLPTWRRYWRLRRRALGQARLAPYDIKAPLTAASPAVPYEQAVQWIVAGMRPLGEEYVAIMERGLRQERWVDVYPNQGKRMGAFSSGVQGTHPFIFMSYSDDLFSLSTLAHELGHSMHSYFTWQSQPPVYADYSLFVAEVASNFNQALVRAYLLETNVEREFQIAVIEEAMSNFHRYFFVMPILALFELEIHRRVEQGQALTAGSLIDLMADLFQEGFGDEVELDHERIGITWAQFHTHLYSNFYVYQYTTGIAGAHALAVDVLAGRAGAAERYLAFLRAGSSLYPLEALRLAGVDMASPEPVEKTFGVLAGLVEKLEGLVPARHG